ncbi:MAG: hypothetical protein K1X55_15230 [Chitinophagales bacterium]|nr:hypothetical protein [Chitinophagales bacterium]
MQGRDYPVCLKLLIFVLALVFTINCSQQKKAISNQENVKPIIVIEKDNFKKYLSLFNTKSIYFKELRIHSIGTDSLVQILDKIGYVNINSLYIYNVNLSNLNYFDKTSVINLRDLTLIKNNIDTLPYIFQNLEKLDELVISRNPAINLDIIFKQLNADKLGALYLEDNNLTEIPQSICDFKNIFILGLNDNYFTELPNYIFNIKTLKQVHFEQNKFSDEYKKVIKDSLSFVKFIYL